MHSLIEEAAKKASVAWITVPGAGPAYPVWCLWIDGALHVVSGPGEQPAPGLEEAAGAGASAAVTLRGDHGGRVVTWPAEVSVLDPAGEEWQPVTTQLAGKRLNATGAAEQTVQRWSRDCRLYRLSPAGDPEQAGPTLPDSELTAPPRPTPAARRVHRPVRLHRVRRR